MWTQNPGWPKQDRLPERGNRFLIIFFQTHPDSHLLLLFLLLSCCCEEGSLILFLSDFICASIYPFWMLLKMGNPSCWNTDPECIQQNVDRMFHSLAECINCVVTGKIRLDFGFCLMISLKMSWSASGVESFELSFRPRVSWVHRRRTSRQLIRCSLYYVH